MTLQPRIIRNGKVVELIREVHNEKPSRTTSNEAIVCLRAVRAHHLFAATGDGRDRAIRAPLWWAGSSAASSALVWLDTDRWPMWSGTRQHHGMLVATQ